MNKITPWHIREGALESDWEQRSGLGRVGGTAIRISARNGNFHIKCFDTDGDLVAERFVDFKSETRAGLFRFAFKMLESGLGEEVEGPHDGAVDQSPQAKKALDAIRGRDLGVPRTASTRRSRSLGKNQKYDQTPTPSQESHSTMTDNTFNDPTLNMFMRVGAHSSKVVASAQAMKICRKIAEKIARKYLPEEHHALLDTKGGAIIVDLITPGVVHALASRQMLPGSEYLEPMSEYALEGSIVRHGIDLTDMAADLMMDLSGELTELVELGKAFAGAAVASQTETEAPDAEPLLPEPVPDLTREVESLRANARGSGFAVNGSKHL